MNFFRAVKKITTFNLKENDVLYIIGDVLYNKDYEYLLANMPACKKVLIKGNYDTDKLHILEKYFDIIVNEWVTTIEKQVVILNHYPSKINPTIELGIVGHIHGLWKVQPNMINVSVDAWHFNLVSEKEILFCYNAMMNYYDENVFPNGRL